MITKIKKHRYIIALIGILLIALFTRSYKVVERFEFAHDGDLYSWIVKDIVVNKHLRLIGQLTSAPGIFVGPFFYYMLVPFFLWTKMDPMGALIPITVIGIFTVVSYGFVFTKLFNKKIGFIAMFLQAILLVQVNFDRAVVPSTPTNIWMIWYFYSIISILRKNYKVLFILGILIGLIWHIHIALIPALIAVPFAFLFTRKLPTLSETINLMIGVAIPSIPLMIFELRNNFSQFLSFGSNLIVNHGGESGLSKFQAVTSMIAKNTTNLFFYPHTIGNNFQFIFLITIILLGTILVSKKFLILKELVVIYIWIGGVTIYFTLSSTHISEYYFKNIEVIFIAFVSLTLYLFYRSSIIGKYLVLLILISFMIRNLYYLQTLQPYKKGYVERKSVAAFIDKDSKRKNYPCVAVSYIVSPGENVGYRYFFWLKNLHVNQASSGSPVYTIVTPVELSPGSVEAKFGHIGVIPPQIIPNSEKIKESCSGLNSNLTDPLFGFTN